MTERETLAAEHALRLLEGEELMEARRLQAAEPAFAAEVVAWEERLAPLFNEIAPVEPGPELWGRIERAMAGNGSGAQVIAMRRKVRRWQVATALAAAAAFALGLLAVPPLLQPPAPPPAAPAEQRPAPVLIASLGDEETPGAIAVTFVPDQRELLVTTAAVPARAERSHQLWLIPAGGSPISLGLVETGQPLRRQLPTELAARFRTGATVALSLEPAGGSPTGQPTGPVLAAGSLQAI